LLRQLDVPPVKVNFFSLYRYATRNDKIIICCSATAAIIGGALMPLMTIIFGNLAGTFQGYFLGTESPSAFTSNLGGFTLYFVYLAIANYVMIFISTSGFLYTGEHITGKNKRAISGCHIETKHWLLRQTWSWRDHDPNHRRHKLDPGWYQ